MSIGLFWRSCVQSAQRIRSHVRLSPFDTSTSHGRSSERYRRILLTTISGFTMRVVSSAIGLVTVPLTLSYLGPSEYGFLSLLSTAVAWFSLIGLNLGKGLQNAIAEAHGKGDRDAAREAFSTALVTMWSIAIVGLACVYGSASFVNWSRILGVSGQIPEHVVQTSVLATFALFLVGLPMSLPATVLGALQRQYSINLIYLIFAAINIPVLLIVIRYHGSIPILVVAMGGGNIVASIIAHFYLTRVAEPWLRVSLLACSRKALRRLARTSVPALLFQIAALLVNESQQIVLARKTNLATVANYSILMRITLIASTVIALGTTAFLPAFREARERGDLDWMRKAFRRMLAARMAIAISLAGGLFLLGNFLLRLWLRRTDVRFDAYTWFALGLGFCAAVWVNAFTDFMTALDDIWRQVALGLFNGVVAVSLSVWLTPRWGILGAVVATYFVAVTLWTWVIPLMTRESRTAASVVAAKEAAL